MSIAQFSSQLSELVSPLSSEQLARLAKITDELTPIQQAWVSGFFAGKFEIGTVSAPNIVTREDKITILYGSQTGNSKGVASQIKQQAESFELASQLISMSDYKTSQLKKEKFLIVAVSTYGEGEPPEAAMNFYDFIFSKKAPRLDDLQIAVIGLGDSSYERFCQTAMDIEMRLIELGASVLYPLAKLDVDYEESSQLWLEEAIARFKPLIATKPTAQPLNSISNSQRSQYGKSAPFNAEVLINQKITGRNSTKDVRHIELSLSDSGLSYQAGDSLGVYFHNDRVLVEALLENVQLSGDETIEIAKQTLSLRNALIEKLELTQSYPKFVEKYAFYTNNQHLSLISQDKGLLRDYLADRQIFDIISQNPSPIGAQELVNCLRQQQSRLYSIASSQLEVDDEVHLTIGIVQYESFSRNCFGGCSGYIANDVAEGNKLSVYVESNDNFRLPDKDETDIIMIGAGTGIAPFRSFLQEREGRGASGNNWLIFGNPHFTEDFLYQVEVQRYVKDGLISKLDLAFSRDQVDKIYVQDRLKQNGEDVYRWLESGCHIYVCGDANHMAKAVHKTLIEILIQYGDLSEESAIEYLTALRISRRYQRDVY